jgi:hypothetical protein
VGWASCVFVALSGVAVLEIGGDGRVEVFAGYGAVLVELSKAKKWLWERGTLARVAGGGHLWWDGSRAWQGRRAFWRSCSVDLGEMDAGKCR